MNTRQCPCGGEFSFNPSRPNKKYCSPRCSQSARNSSDKRSNKEKHSAREAKRGELEFIAVDGEGVTREAEVLIFDDETSEEVYAIRSIHEYVLLTVGDQSLHRNGEALHHDEIFEFLYAQFLQNPEAAFVGFFLGYDFSQWLKSLTPREGFYLFHKRGIAKRTPQHDKARFPWPVKVWDRATEGAKWEIDILGTKRFKLRPFLKKEDWPDCQVAHKTPELIDECFEGKHKKNPTKWMYICDAGSFFQTSLLNAIDPKGWPSGPVVTDAEWEILKRGKEARATAEFDEAMIEYNVLENEVLSRLLTRLNEGFLSDHIQLNRNQWFGPGQAAQKWMSLINAPTGAQVREVIPEYADTAARWTYYGGWFETFIHGPIPGTVYGYDINSAYPHAISQLPCLLHGQWTKGKGRPGKLSKGRWRIVHAEFEGHDPHMGTMPHRNREGGVLRPRITTGWHWQHEIDAARRAGAVTRMKWLEWIEYAPCDCPPPYAAISELYESRLSVGKNSPQGKAKKLVYNSAYGKMAQSIGEPKYANPVYASLITSITRTMILDAIATHPNKSRDLAMVATDGIYFISPHPNLQMDEEKLGYWGEDHHENLSILMPGLYWDDKSRESVRSGKSIKLKSRGVSAKYLSRFIDRLDEQWERLRTTAPKNGDAVDPRRAPKVDITIDFAVISPSLATTRDKWEQCGAVIHNESRTIDSNPENKRYSFYVDDGIIRSHPRTVSSTEELETIGYPRLFGTEVEGALQGLAELNEWLTPDLPNAAHLVRAVLPD